MPLIHVVAQSVGTSITWDSWNILFISSISHLCCYLEYPVPLNSCVRENQSQECIRDRVIYCILCASLYESSINWSQSLCYFSGLKPRVKLHTVTHRYWTWTYCIELIKWLYLYLCIKWPLLRRFPQHVQLRAHHPHHPVYSKTRVPSKYSICCIDAGLGMKWMLLERYTLQIGFRRFHCGISISKIIIVKKRESVRVCHDLGISKKSLSTCQNQIVKSYD